MRIVILVHKGVICGRTHDGDGDRAQPPEWIRLSQPCDADLPGSRLDSDLWTLFPPEDSHVDRSEWWVLHRPPFISVSVGHVV